MNGKGTAPAHPLIEEPLALRLRSNGTRGGEKAFVHCPKCSAPAFVRRSQTVTETIKDLDAVCSNTTGCGHTFKMQLAFVYSYSPGLIERPDLPVCPREQVPHIMPPSRDGPEDDPDQLRMFG